jgi:hypothetical protein
MANPNSEARLGYGTKLLMGDGGSPETFAEIAEVGDFEDSDSVELVEVTNHQSPGGRKEYIGDLIDGDEISFECNYIPTHATHDTITGLRAKLKQRVNFRIEAPGETLGTEFPAIVMNVGRSFPVSGGAMKLMVTIKKTGAVTTYSIA